jgi:hypothetical protein
MEQSSASVRTEAGTHTQRIASLQLANVCWFLAAIVDGSSSLFCSLRPYIWSSLSVLPVHEIEREWTCIYFSLLWLDDVLSDLTRTLSARIELDRLVWEPGMNSAGCHDVAWSLFWEVCSFHGKSNSFSEAMTCSTCCPKQQTNRNYRAQHYLSACWINSAPLFARGIRLIWHGYSSIPSVTSPIRQKIKRPATHHPERRSWQ